MAGRPKAPLPRAVHPLTVRVRALVDQAHGGNLSEAARATDLPYPTLRELYVGGTTNPSLRTLHALAAPYELSVAWFADPNPPTGLPVSGVVGLLQPHPSTPQQRHRLRRIAIPFSAWPMVEVYRRLEAWLESLPPGSGRPIVAEATAEAFTFRLTSFLLAPLLAAERLGEPDVIPFDSAQDQPVVPPGEVGAHWVLQLRRLGELWAVVLEDLLDRSQASPP